jgi:hypothetical protein
MKEEGIVYVLSNEAMPGLIKIGLTTRNELQSRINELYTTSVPVPFTCEYASRVDDCAKVEQALHQAFSTDRINPNREFFRMSVERVIPILKLVEKEEITATVRKDIDKDISETDRQASNNLKKQRRPPLNFVEMNIPMGAELLCPYEETDYKVIVCTPRKVKFNDEETSLTATLRQIMNITWDVQPTPYFYYNGRLLSDIYNETYTNVDDE